MKLKRLFKMFFIIAAGVLLITAVSFYISTDGLAQFGARPSGARLERIMNSPQYDGEKFVNAWPVNMSWGFSEYYKMFSKWFFSDGNRTPKMNIPYIQLDANSFTDHGTEDLRVTWLGHSTALIEMDGYRVLTDPVWSKRSSPTTLMGPGRFFPVPIAIEDLPPLDAVLISHEHYDHLDKKAVQKLAETGIGFHVPLGIGAHLEKWKVDPSQIHTYDWWDSVSIDEGRLTIIAAPARHFSGRGPFDGENPTLWVTFIIIGPNNRVFFSGDTGLFPLMADIGEKYGPFDLTLMKIGAYDPMWPDIHLNPEQTVEAHRALRGKVLMPIHWGTFNLAFHDWNEPPERLCAAANKEGITYFIPRPGQIVTVSDPPAINHWWRE